MSFKFYTGEEEDISYAASYDDIDQMTDDVAFNDPSDGDLFYVYEATLVATYRVKTEIVLEKV